MSEPFWKLHPADKLRRIANDIEDNRSVVVEISEIVHPDTLREIAKEIDPSPEVDDGV